MRILTIDFETRSADDLKSVGVYHYAADPSTDVLCLALKERGAEPVVWMPEERLTPEVRFAAQAFVDAEETAILNGDTDGTHQDSDVGASTTDARTAWDGLRKRGLANAGSSGGNATATVAKVRTARALMGKWGLNPMDLVAISAIGPYYDLLGDSEVTSVEKYGAAATILNGELAKVAGVPLVVSEHIREDMNASGVYDGSTTDRTSIILVNRRQWALGQRMAIDVEVDDSIYRETYQRVVVAFMREDFQNLGASADDDTAVLYNIT